MREVAFRARGGRSTGCLIGDAVAVALGLASLAVTLPPARAAEIMAFTPAALDVAKASGKPILVEVTALRCTVCLAQTPIVSRLLAEPAYVDVVYFRVDFDSQGPALRKLGVSAEGTLIAFRGGEEIARLTGDTDATRIKALVDRSL